MKYGDRVRSERFDYIMMSFYFYIVELNICWIIYMCIFFLQKIYGPEAERNFYESQLIILDTLEKVLNGVSYD